MQDVIEFRNTCAFRSEVRIDNRYLWLALQSCPTELNVIMHLQEILQHTERKVRRYYSPNRGKLDLSRILQSRILPPIIIFELVSIVICE